MNVNSIQLTHNLWHDQAKLEAIVSAASYYQPVLQDDQQGGVVPQNANPTAQTMASQSSVIDASMVKRQIDQLAHY